MSAGLFRPFFGAALFFLTACGSSSTPSKNDGKATQGDGTSSCAEIIDCLETKCSADDTACAEECYAKGTAEAQRLFDVANTCYENETTRSCKSLCASDPESDSCYSCLTKACEKQVSACQNA
jgi:hypothetical protein